MVEGGESFTIKRPRRRSDRFPVPIQFQVLEADHLDQGKNGEYPGGAGQVRYGIEYDATGRRIAYWFFRITPATKTRSPGGRFIVSGSKRSASFTCSNASAPNRGAFHGEPRRFGRFGTSTIGKPPNWFGRRPKLAWSGLSSARTKPNNPSRRRSKTPTGTRSNNSNRAWDAYARGGKDIKFNTPGTTAGVYEWHSVMLHIIAAGWRIPYELLTGDLKQVNFSSSRVGLQEFRRMIEALQWQMLIPYALPTDLGRLLRSGLHRRQNSPTVDPGRMVPAALLNRSTRFRM